MRGGISVLNSEMNAVHLFVSNLLRKGSLGLFNVNIFDLIPLTACENNTYVCSGCLWVHFERLGIHYCDVVLFLEKVGYWIGFEVSLITRLLLLSWCFFRKRWRSLWTVHPQ